MTHGFVTSDTRGRKLDYDAPDAQYADVLREAEKGEPTNTLDLIDALWWRLRNQRREIARLHQQKRAAKLPPLHVDPTGTTREPPHCPSCSCGTTDRRRPAAIPTEGVLEVGLTSDETSVVLNHPQIEQDEHGGHIIFSPQQAQEFARLLLKKAGECSNVVR